MLPVCLAPGALLSDHSRRTTSCLAADLTAFRFRGTLNLALPLHCSIGVLPSLTPAVRPFATQSAFTYGRPRADEFDLLLDPLLRLWRFLHAATRRRTRDWANPLLSSGLRSLFSSGISLTCTALAGLEAGRS